MPAQMQIIIARAGNNYRVHINDDGNCVFIGIFVPVGSGSVLRQLWSVNDGQPMNSTCSSIAEQARSRCKGTYT